MLAPGFAGCPHLFGEGRLSSPSESIRAIWRHRIVVPVAAGSVAGVVFTSKDLYLTPAAAGTMTVVVVVLLRRLFAERLGGRRYFRIAQAASLCAVPVAFSAGLSVNSGYLFSSAFGADPPAGLRGFTVDASLLNPAGKRTVLMRFAADRATFEGVLSRGGFRPDAAFGEAMRDGENWAAVLHQAFGDFGRFGGAGWQDIPRMDGPDCREWRRREGGARLETRVLYDAVSGQAYVLYTVR
jgi:hypothetical protein